MIIHEAEAKSILRKYKTVDSWFIAAYGMNLYRGCIHNCAYCDGRTEKYNVDSDFGSTVTVKTNTPLLLEKELNPAKKRVPMKRSYIMIGGGVGDGYQEAEKKYRITRQALELCLRYRLPVHVLTKSSLVRRDVNLLKEIHDRAGAIVSISLSSTDDRGSSITEPGATPPSERMETLSLLKNNGIPAGVYLMPVIPFITDTPEAVGCSLHKVHSAGADFIAAGALTLKEGRQKEFFYSFLRREYPHLIPQYDSIYGRDLWGSPSEEYLISMNKTLRQVNEPLGLPMRIPPRLFADIVDENDYVRIILDQMHHLLRSSGLKSPYGYAAHAISKLPYPLISARSRLRTIRGIGHDVEKIILEIFDTGTSSYYESLLRGYAICESIYDRHG